MGMLTKEQAKVARETLKKVLEKDPSLTTAQLEARGFTNTTIRRVRKELGQKTPKDQLFLTEKEKKKLKKDNRKTNNDLFVEG